MQKVQEMLGKGANPRLRDSIIGIMKGKRYCERDEFDAVPEVISLKNGFYDAKRRRMLTFRGERHATCQLTQFPRNYRGKEDDEAGSGGSERYERALADMFGGNGNEGREKEEAIPPVYRRRAYHAEVRGDEAVHDDARHDQHGEEHHYQTSQSA